MRFSDQQLSAFGVALNEATLLAVEVNPELRRAVVTIELPVAGTDLTIDGRLTADADDRRMQLVLEPIGRVAASLRHGHWDDPRALEEPLELEQLEEVVADFDGAPIYGWEFIDVDDDEGFDRWYDRLSFDWSTGDDGTDHTLDLSQAHGVTRHLDLRLWFDVLTMFGPGEHQVSLKAFLARASDEPGARP